MWVGSGSGVVQLLWNKPAEEADSVEPSAVWCSRPTFSSRSLAVQVEQSRMKEKLRLVIIWARVFSRDPLLRSC